MLFSRPLDLSPLADRRKHKRINEVRRRPAKAQARALDLLAHALEYLVDSTINSCHPASAAIMQAVELLAQKSRAVFAECPEIQTPSQRLIRLLPAFLTLPGMEEDPSTLSRIHRTPGNPPRDSRDDTW